MRAIHSNDGGANGILTRTLHVNDVELGVTWSSNKGSMVHGQAPHMDMPHASSARNSGGTYAHKFGVATPFKALGAFPCISWYMSYICLNVGAFHG